MYFFKCNFKICHYVISYRIINLTSRSEEDAVYRGAHLSIYIHFFWINYHLFIIIIMFLSPHKFHGRWPLTKRVTFVSFAIIGHPAFCYFLCSPWSQGRYSGTSILSSPRDNIWSVWCVAWWQRLIGGDTLQNCTGQKEMQK